MKKKNLLLMTMSLVLIAAIAVGTTLAYFTDTTDSATNTFTTGQVDIDIVDDGTDPDGPEGPIKPGDPSEDPDQPGLNYDDVTPGDELAKKVGITVAEDSMNAYVAVKVEIHATPGANSTITEAEAEAAVAALVEEAYDKENWTKTQLADGTDMYVYNSVVSAEDEVLLFETLKVPEDWDNDYAGLSFEIVVSGAAVQADNVTPENAPTELAKLFDTTLAE